MTDRGAMILAAAIVLVALLAAWMFRFETTVRGGIVVVDRWRGEMVIGYPTDEIVIDLVGRREVRPSAEKYLEQDR